MQINSPAEALFIACLQAFLLACIFTGSGKFLHTHGCHAVGIRIKRAGTAGTAEIIKMGIQFLPDPFDAGLDQGDEVKECMEKRRKILLRIVAIVRYDLSLVYADGRKLLQRILHRNDIGLVARLLCKSNRLPCSNRVKGEQLDSLPAVVRFVEAISGFRYLAGIG